jgi:uncharacterized protein
MNPEISLTLLRDTLAICRFEAGTDLPAWAQKAGDFHSITRTSDEVSIVLPQKNIGNQEISCERDWRALRVDGKLDFSLCGVLSSILDILKDASVPVFVISTYDTDYVLVKEQEVTKTTAALRKSFAVNKEQKQ